MPFRDTAKLRTRHSWFITRRHCRRIGLTAKVFALAPSALVLCHTAVYIDLTAGLLSSLLSIVSYRIGVEKRRLGSLFVLLLVSHFITITYHSN